MAIMESPKGKVCQFDDFLGDTLNGDLYVTTVDTSGTVAITDVEIDGTLQIDTDTTSADAGSIASNLNWRVQDGYLRAETRIKITPITNTSLYIGFTDATTESSQTLPMALSGTTWTTTASTAIGFMFDTAATTDVIYAQYVDDDADSGLADATLQFSGLAPIANEYYTYIIELSDAGSGNQCIAEMSVIDSSGRVYTKRFNSTIDRDAVLCFYVGHKNNSSAANETTIDYIEIEKGRASTID